MKYRFSIFRNIAVLAAALLLGTVLTGCAGTWGSLKTSPELVSGVNAKSLDADLVYYYCGRSGLPYAVVGIDKTYAFKSKFWFKIDTMDEVYEKIDRLADLEAGQYIRYAREILAPDGRSLGVYFSYYYATTITVDEAEKTIWVANPYKPDSRMHGGF